MSSKLIAAKRTFSAMPFPPLATALDINNEIEIKKRHADFR